MNNSSDGPAQSERKDFDDGANALWSLYSKEAQAHDEALFQGLLADMSGVPTFAGLFAALSLPSSSTVLRICNLILHNNRYTISSNRSRCSPRSHSRSHLSPHRSLSHPPPHHLTQYSTLKGKRGNELFLARRPHSQLGCSVLCNFRSTGSSVPSANLSAVRSTSEASAVSTIFFRCYLVSAVGGVNSHCYDPFLALLFFLGLGISMFDVNTTIGIVTVVFIIIFFYPPMALLGLKTFT
ncbi:hypothetical protein H4582DRAFT_2102968 [Lactarius indigo]|nr:hypothetical protein H4582DRAFT_2102968 [Lactarius indigo]